MDKKHCKTCIHYDDNCDVLACFNGGASFIKWESQTNIKKSCDDNVNHPAHYTAGKIEVIDFIEDQKFGYLAGNIIKYVSRYRYKNGIEDLKKAEFYLKRLLRELENDSSHNGE